jgi:hypothetical protein
MTFCVKTNALRTKALKTKSPREHISAGITIKGVSLPKKVVVVLKTE